MRQGCPPNEWKIAPLAPEGTTVLQTSLQDRVFAGSPSIAALPGGRLIAALDQSGPGVRNLPGSKGKLPLFNRWLQGRVFTSNDEGQTWTSRADFPFCNPCLFRDGATLYMLGHDDNLQIAKSLDGGETWSKPVALTRDGGFGDTGTQSPASVLSANGNFYAVAMRISDFSNRGGLSSRATPIVLRAQQNSVLGTTKAWSLCSPGKSLLELLPPGTPEGIGLPFFPAGEHNRGRQISKGRWAQPIGWSAAHLIQIRSSDHDWYDPGFRKLHFLARGEVHRTNIAVLATVTEDPQGNMTFGFERTPAGKPWIFLPVPGGHAKFDILYDEPSRLFWLAGNQSTDSLVRPERLPDQRPGLPCEETHRLQLHFSKNLVDWSFAGLITLGAKFSEARHSCSMTVRGNDLCVLCCSGEAASRNAAETTRVTHHLIPGFRSLVY